MSKQKTRNTKPSIQTERSKRSRLRNVKVTSAALDDPIYSVGFVVGGKRLQGSRQPESKSQNQSTEDPEGKNEEIPLVERAKKVAQAMTYNLNENAKKGKLTP